MPRQSLNTIKDLCTLAGPLWWRHLGTQPLLHRWLLEARNLPRTKQQSLAKEERRKKERRGCNSEL